MQGNVGGDNVEGSVRIGYHPGVRIYVPPPPPPPPPAPPQNRPPTVKARCEPCTVEVGKSSTVTADAQDPDGDTLTYKWSVADRQVRQSRPIARRSGRRPSRKAPCRSRSPWTTARAGRRPTRSRSRSCKPPVKEYKFEDVHFDFDRYSLRPEATRMLDEAVRALTDNPELKIEIEGHTCNIGTAEYNLALGERRATSVRDYLTVARRRRRSPADGQLR